jgi:hypothetical protein
MENEQQEQTQEVTEPQLTLADIALMGNIINIVSRRGAFEAGDLKTVGELYEKIVAFLPKPEEQGAETANTSEEVANDDGQTKFEFVQDEASAE